MSDLKNCCEMIFDRGHCKSTWVLMEYIASWIQSKHIHKGEVRSGIRRVEEDSDVLQQCNMTL